MPIRRGEVDAPKAVESRFAGGCHQIVQKALPAIPGTVFVGRVVGRRSAEISTPPAGDGPSEAWLITPHDSFGRNRLAFGLSVLAVAASVAGIVSKLLQVREARAQRDFANRQLGAVG